MAWRRRRAWALTGPLGQRPRSVTPRLTVVRRMACSNSAATDDAPAFAHTVARSSGMPIAPAWLTSRARWRSPAKGMRLKAASVSNTPSPSVRPRSKGSMRPDERVDPDRQTALMQRGHRGGPREERRQQGVAVLGQHGFGMELHAERRVHAMAQRHHLAVLAPGAGLELGRILRRRDTISEW